MWVRSGRLAGTLAVAMLVACSSGTEDRGTQEARPKVEVLTQGGPFRGTNGILFGPDGNLWVASVVTPVLAVMSPETGEIVERFGPESGVKGPDDLAFGPDGSVYWTDISFGDVGRRRPDGTTSVVASLGPGVNPITFSDDGRLFVSQCFFGSGLFEIDPEGGAQPRSITDKLGPGCGLNGMDWGPDGYLYGPRWFHGEVVRVDVDSGEFERVAGDFGVPAAVKFDAEGRLHVLDSLRGEVVRVDSTGEREVVGRVPASSADNLAFDQEGRLFVSSFGDGSIVEVLADGVRTVSKGGLNMPGGLVLLPGPGGDRLFVADFFALRGLDPATGEEIHTARDIIGFSDLGSVMTVAADGANLVLTSWFDNSVKLWSPDSDHLVASYSDFGRPIHAIPFDDDIVVTEYDTGSVVRFDPLSPETRTAIATGLEEPAGLASVGDALFVADRRSGQLLQVVAGGEVLSPPRVIAGGLSGPEAIAAGPSGELFVVEADAGRVSRVDPASGDRTTIAEGLELHVPAQGDFPSTMLFNGLAVGEDRLFVTGDRANCIYRLRL